MDQQSALSITNVKRIMRAIKVGSFTDLQGFIGTLAKLAKAKARLVGLRCLAPT